MTEAPAPLRVVVADDQASVRQGLVLLLDLLPDIEVVAAAANGQEAIDLVTQHRPDAVLLDLHMPVLDGIETTRILTERHPEVAIVVLTTYADDSSVLAALGAGAVATSPRTPTAPTLPWRCAARRAACPCLPRRCKTHWWPPRPGTRWHPTQLTTSQTISPMGSPAEKARYWP